MAWKEPKGAAVKNTLPVRDIQTIRSGLTTPALERRHLVGKNPREDCCFSIITRNRDLDLEASTPALRDQWVRNLKTLIKWRKLNKLA